MCQYCDTASEQADKYRYEEFQSNLFHDRHEIETNHSIGHITDLEFTGKLSDGSTIKGKINGSLWIENHISIYRFGNARFFWDGFNVVDKIVGNIRGEFVPDESGACYYIMTKDYKDGNVD